FCTPLPAPAPAPQGQPVVAALEVLPPPVHVAAQPDLADGEMPLREQKMLGSVRDRLRDQFSRLEQGPMAVLEYEARFHELSRHDTMILPMEEEGVRCFHIHRETQGGSDKRARSGRLSSKCYDCSALDHWSKECPRRGRWAIVPAPPAPRQVSAVPSLARCGGQDQDRRDNRQGTRGGARRDMLSGRSDAPGKGAQSHFYAAPARVATESGTLLLCRMRSESLAELVHVSTLVDESLVVDQISRFIGLTFIELRSSRVLRIGAETSVTYLREGWLACEVARPGVIHPGLQNDPQLGVDANPEVEAGPQYLPEIEMRSPKQHMYLHNQ
ncbi:hypothetical protein MTR67_023857, partial [Solanum verrucosum]